MRKEKKCDIFYFLFFCFSTSNDQYLDDDDENDGINDITPPMSEDEKTPPMSAADSDYQETPPMSDDTDYEEYVDDGKLLKTLAAKRQKLDDGVEPWKVLDEAFEEYVKNEKVDLAWDCLICKSKVGNRTELLKHIQQVHCQSADLTSSSESTDLRGGFQWHANGSTEEGVHSHRPKCDICGLKLESPEMYLAHIENEECILIENLKLPRDENE